MGTAIAQEHGSASEAQKMARDAIAHVKAVGTEKAFQEFDESGKWRVKDLYVFCYKFDGTCACNGNNKALIGRNLIDFVYPDGQKQIRNMVQVAQTKGSGWIDYQWPHPQTKKIAAKSAWVTKIPGYDGFLALGIYK